MKKEEPLHLENLNLDEKMNVFPFLDLNIEEMFQFYKKNTKFKLSIKQLSPEILCAPLLTLYSKEKKLNKNESRFLAELFHPKYWDINNSEKKSEFILLYSTALMGLWEKNRQGFFELNDLKHPIAQNMLLALIIAPPSYFDFKNPKGKQPDKKFQDVRNIHNKYQPYLDIFYKYKETFPILTMRAAKKILFLAQAELRDMSFYKTKIRSYTLKLTKEKQGLGTLPINLTYTDLSNSINFTYSVSSNSLLHHIPENLDGFDFTGSNLTNSCFLSFDMTVLNLREANLKNISADSKTKIPYSTLDFLQCLQLLQSLKFSEVYGVEAGYEYETRSSIKGRLISLRNNIPPLNNKEAILRLEDYKQIITEEIKKAQDYYNNNFFWEKALVKLEEIGSYKKTDKLKAVIEMLEYLKTPDKEKNTEEYLNKKTEFKKGIYADGRLGEICAKIISIKETTLKLDRPKPDKLELEELELDEKKTPKINKF
jgi:hypothetical protein